MTVMNRLSPLIVRRQLTPIARRAVGVSAPIDWHQDQAFAGANPAKWLEELKLFATGWIGGLIFFGTYLG